MHLWGQVHAWAKWIPPLPSRLWLQARVFHVWQRHKAADASEKGMRRVIPEARAATVDEPSQAAVLCRVVPVLRLQGENIAPEVAAVPKVADEQTCEKKTVYAAHRCAVRDQVSPHPRVSKSVWRSDGQTCSGSHPQETPCDCRHALLVREAEAPGAEQAELRQHWQIKGQGGESRVEKELRRVLPLDLTRGKRCTPVGRWPGPEGECQGGD